MTKLYIIAKHSKDSKVDPKSFRKIKDYYIGSMRVFVMKSTTPLHDQALLKQESVEHCLETKYIDWETLNPIPFQLSLKVDSVAMKQNLINIAFPNRTQRIIYKPQKLELKFIQ